MSAVREPAAHAATAHAATAHHDTFARDRLPAADLLPAFPGRDALGYPARLNAAAELLGRHVAEGRGGRVALLTPTETLTYAALDERVNRLANALTRDLGLVPGERVLLRAANTPWMVAAHFAVLKAGGIVVATMPLLRAGELAGPLKKSRARLALCDARLAGELEAARALAPDLERVALWGTDAPDGVEALLAQPGYERFEAAPTFAEDVALIAFTSGTTGEPKGTVHAHADLLAVCDHYGARVLGARATDRFIGSPPLAFTFGLGGLVLFPFRVGASSVLLERAGAEDLLPAIARFRATVVFTAPTAYRAMAGRIAAGEAEGLDLSCLRRCVSAGEALPAPTFEAWRAATGVPLLDGIGSTEMLHIFLSNRPGEERPGSTGRPVPGYEARVIGEDGREVPPGTPGRLAVRGPTGCRYLDDPRQRAYVQAGWNVTGDTYVMLADGTFAYQARSDDMIVTAGYNVAGPEVEAAVLAHPAVAECGVVGAPCPERGTSVTAYVVLRPGFAPGAAMEAALKEHVKAVIAPYKAPRAVRFADALPRNGSGKLQRFALRAMAAEEAAAREAGAGAAS